MMHVKIFHSLALIVGAVLLLTGCSLDSKEESTSEYQNMQADFVEAHVNADKKVDYVLTDEDQQLTLQSLYQADWLEKADTVYRAVLYYKPSGSTVETVRLSKISVPEITPKASLKVPMKTDPITMESLWVSKNKRYLNMGFYVKVGAVSGQQAFHRMGIVSDTLMKNADNTHTLYLKLYHDQGGVPEYYSQHSYFSVPLKGLTADSVRLTVNTYKGEMVKTLSI